MTLHELIDTLWQERITLSFKDGVPVATPAARLLALPGVAEALTEHRGAILRYLRGLDGARLEGLVCGRCCPEAVPGNPDLIAAGLLRHCSAPGCQVDGRPWPTPHYPRRS